MKYKLALASLLLFVASLFAGCSYGGVATVDEDTVVITKNDHFLFGALRSVYVCQVTDSGVTNCAEKDAP